MKRPVPPPPKPATSNNFEPEDYESPPTEELLQKNCRFQGNDGFKQFPPVRVSQNVQKTLKSPIKTRPVFPVPLSSQNEGHQSFSVNSPRHMNFGVRPPIAIKPVHPVPRSSPTTVWQPPRNFGPPSVTSANEIRFRNSSQHESNIQKLHKFHQPNLITSVGTPHFLPPINNKLQKNGDDGHSPPVLPTNFHPNRPPIFKGPIQVARPILQIESSRPESPWNPSNAPSASNVPRYNLPSLHHSLSQKFLNTDNVNRFSPPPPLAQKFQNTENVIRFAPPLVPVSKPSPSLVPVNKPSPPPVPKPSSQFDQVHGSYPPVVPNNKPASPLITHNKPSPTSAVKPLSALISNQSSQQFLPNSKQSPSVVSIPKPSATIIPNQKPTLPLMPKSISAHSISEHLPKKTSTENEYLKLDNGEAIPMTELYKSLLQEKYFHPIHKGSSGDYLPDGTFLLRPSKTRTEEKPLTLCLRHNGKVFVFSVERRKSGLYSIGSEKEGELQFETVQDMILYYRRNPFYFEGYETYFVHPGTEPPST